MPRVRFRNRLDPDLVAFLSIAVPVGGLVHTGRPPSLAVGTITGPTVWTDVTPGDVTLDPNGTAAGANNNYACQGVVADPTNQSILYTPYCYQGLWKSPNYGLTWTKVTVTSGSDPMGNGRPNLRMAPDGSYLISTALYPINGLSNGAWKSLNGGQTWTRYAVGAPNADDMGEFNILPTDKNRVVGVCHSSPFAMYESRDAGETWTDQGTPGSTAPCEPLWVDADHIIAIGHGDNGSGPGTYLGTRSGSSWPWTWSWASVSNQQHWHGVTQMYIDPSSGALYLGGGFGVQKSTDGGATWSVVDATFSAGIVGTATKLYSTANYAALAGFGPYLQHADRSPGTSWSDDTPPGGLTNGWLYAAAVTDGVKWAIVSGNWNAGNWRLVEP